MSQALDEWFRDRCVSNAAAVAFFALFSLAPMLVLVVTVAGYGAQSGEVATLIFSQLRLAIGDSATSAIEQTVSNANLSQWSGSATVLSLVFTLVGASATFTELKAALNSIFLGPAPRDSPFAAATWAFLRARLLSGALVLGIGLVTVIVMTAEGLGILLKPHIAPSVYEIFRPITQVLDVLRFDTFTTIALLAIVFTVLLVLLPDTTIHWRKAFIAAVVGACLFTAGKYAFEMYLKVAGTANAFGAAGSAAVTLMWIFYSAAVFLFSAEILKVLQTEKTSSSTINATLPKVKNEY